jgi:hypothetical protein
MARLGMSLRPISLRKRLPPKRLEGAAAFRTRERNASDGARSWIRLDYPRLLLIWAALPNGTRSLRLRYCVPMASIQQSGKPSRDAAAEAEAVRMQRLRADAQRPMSVNLAEGIALSHKLMRFTGSARSD